MKEKPSIPSVRITLKTEYNSRHPWIFNKMVNHPRRRPEAGSLVEVYTRDGNFVGRGLYHPERTVAVRLLSKDPRQKIDGDFVFQRLEAAKRFREETLGILETSDSYRLVHGEADGFPGLVIDKFASVIVIEPFSAGYLTLGPLIAEALEKLYPGSRPCFRADKKTEKKRRRELPPAREGLRGPGLRGHPGERDRPRGRSRGRAQDRLLPRSAGKPRRGRPARPGSGGLRPLLLFRRLRLERCQGRGQTGRVRGPRRKGPGRGRAKREKERPRRRVRA